jgi:hypothetical protein
MHRSAAEQILVNEALNQMLGCFYCHRMITVFPVGPVPILPLIKFLPAPSRDQLHRVGNDISFTGIPDQEMDVVRCG